MRETGRTWDVDSPDTPHEPGNSEFHERALEPAASRGAAFHERALETVAGAGSRPAAAPALERVSVVVGARNYGHFLGPCLHSIYAQTRRPAEVIYADDGSEDDSLAVARAFEAHGLKVLALPFRGVAAVRNAGAEATTGDLLLFVDGDNLLTPDFLRPPGRLAGRRSGLRLWAKALLWAQSWGLGAPGLGPGPALG